MAAENIRRINTQSTRVSLYQFGYQDDVEHVRVMSYFQLWSFATTGETIKILIGIFFSILASLAIPLGIVVFADIVTLIVDRVRLTTSSNIIMLQYFGGGRVLINGTVAENKAALFEDAVAYVIATSSITIIQFVFIAASISLLSYTALAQVTRIRKKLLKSIVRQEMAWFELREPHNIAAMLTTEIDALRDGIGAKLAIFLYHFSATIFCTVIALVFGWKLAVVLLGCTPIIILSRAATVFTSTILADKEVKSNSESGSIAEEVFQSIKTVIAFGGEKTEAQRFRESLLPVEESRRLSGLYSGISEAFLLFFIYSIYALGYWYGTVLILDDRDNHVENYTAGIMILVLFCVISGAQCLGYTSPQWDALMKAKVVGTTIFSIIARKSSIDSLSRNGVMPPILNGNIEFQNVYFSYPTRLNVQVLRGLDLKIKAQTTVAFVGPSGSGKSTCLELFQRMYDPLIGNITLDGRKISQFNVHYLRSQMGVVAQEPDLFRASIKDNIGFGKENVTDKEIEEAARIANCHNFIKRLAHGYNTMIGNNDTQLSGGQKQRIAIARAIIRNPKFLLLDEATSSLDSQSEKIVQKALERASRGRTTLVVSHRLSTIFNADKIVFLSEGVVAEQGTHDQLMELKGMYYAMVYANGLDTKRKARATLAPHMLMSLDDEVDQDDGDGDTPLSTSNSSEEVEYRATAKDIILLNAPQWHFLVIGIICAIICGAAFPISAIIFGEVLGTLLQKDEEEARLKSTQYALLYFIIGLIAAIANFMQTYALNTASIRLSSGLRMRLFETILQQDMSWFDEKKNSVGALCTRLFTDCSAVQGATGTRNGALLQSFSTIIFGIAISFYYSVQLTLITFFWVVFILMSVMWESRYTMFHSKAEKGLMEETMKFTVEAISNIKTTLSLCYERPLLERFDKEMREYYKCSKKQLKFHGIVFGMGQTIPLFAYGLTLFCGGIFVAQGELEYRNVLKVSEALIFGTWMLGQTLVHTPNLNSAIAAIGRILSLIKRKPKYLNPTNFVQDENWKADGNVKFENVEFSYPSRPNDPVLRGLNFNVLKNQLIALVGASGCGKSTCTQLLLRFYDPDAGSVKLDDMPTTMYPVRQIRSQIGLVSQEPVLFNRTIADNIAYGDNDRIVRLPDIIRATKQANVHDFINALPRGYRTRLGPKGTQLSGGEKQRIAIARALVRNPRVLLLDEATSALDYESEQKVQIALDQASVGRTCICIAHRLSTIQDADLICVLHNGVVVERGTHAELIELNRMYAQFYYLQQISF